MHVFLTNPIVHKVFVGSLSGWAASAHTDYLAFQTWKTWQAGLQYDWATATLRWVQGAIAGALVGAGFSAFL